MRDLCATASGSKTLADTPPHARIPYCKTDCTGIDVTRSVIHSPTSPNTTHYNPQPSPGSLPPTPHPTGITKLTNGPHL
ncbi:hypothetical protein J6590_072159 [Homalodisca vitripennis]|nr:hypothetical protein J6590_072159 [Homalodisca vitripennis]